MENSGTIWTIGHSTRSEEEFIELLKVHDIELVADIRFFPGSRRYPHFNSENISKTLAANNIGYRLIPLLGGRRKVLGDSPNTRWRNASFRGYADYMETPGFRKGIEELTALASKQSIAFMCSEAVWWRCHRSMVSDFLKSEGWKVLHIMDTYETKEHPYTPAAQILNGKLTYHGDGSS